MARYKHIDTSPRFLAVDLQRQLIPGTFEHALCHLIDHEIDLSGFDSRYPQRPEWCNRLSTGDAAQDRPLRLLSRGIIRATHSPAKSI